MSVWETTAVRASGISMASEAASAVRAREQVLLNTQATEDAVLRPRDPGAYAHDIRAALAARIARLNGETELARFFMADAEDSDAAGLADPAGTGHGGLPPFVVAFMDRVAMSPREIRAEDIEALKTAGVADPDIVRLCELNAFLAYEIRLIAGLRLLREKAA